MKEGLEFSYDGRYSAEFGIFNVSVDSGLFNEEFVAERTILETVIRGNEKPYLQGVKRSPLILKLTFAFDGYYDSNKIREVAKWLDRTHYRPFFTTDNPERIFYCMLNSSSELLHNGLKQGYINLQMRCDSPYSYSPTYTTKTYSWANVPIILKEDNVGNLFIGGTLFNVTTNVNKNLILNPAKTIWTDIANPTIWDSF